jgi:two-component sensor histidine kinase
LGDLLSVLLAPYDDQGAFAGRIRVAVPRMGVGEGTATTLAMVIHELATNSVKHGALSADAGTLDVSSTTDERDVFLTWAETGGPAIAAAPEMHGFGSKLISRSMSQQFDGGSILRLAPDWTRGDASYAQGPARRLTLFVAENGSLRAGKRSPAPQN